MSNFTLENPQGMWIRYKSGVYQSPLFGEGTPNPLFNSLPNSPYLTNGQTLQYMGFLEGLGGITEFDATMLFVVLDGNATCNDEFLTAQQATFANKIVCAENSIIMVFMPKDVADTTVRTLVSCKQEITQTPYLTKYRVYGEILGDNLFFAAYSGLNYTYHTFTQITSKNTARGAHALDFYKKNVIIQRGSIEMKSYLPNENLTISTLIKKTSSFYEGYYLSGFVYHAFKAVEDAIDTMLVERPYGIKEPERLPVKLLFGENIYCNARDAQLPNQMQRELLADSQRIII